MNDVRKDELRRSQQDELHRLKLEEKLREKTQVSENEEKLKLEKREKALKVSEKLESLQEKWIAPPLVETKKAKGKSAGRSEKKTHSDVFDSSDDDVDNGDARNPPSPRVSDQPRPKKQRRGASTSVFDSDESSDNEEKDVQNDVSLETNSSKRSIDKSHPRDEISGSTAASQDSTLDPVAKITRRRVISDDENEDNNTQSHEEDDEVMKM